jgi:hypothetical protein
MKSKRSKQKGPARRTLGQHFAAIASSPLGREIAMAAAVAVATAITSADRRQGLLKTIGGNLRQALIASLAPVIDELVGRSGKKKAAAAE